MVWVPVVYKGAFFVTSFLPRWRKVEGRRRLARLSHAPGFGGKRFFAKEHLQPINKKPTTYTTTIYTVLVPIQAAGIDVKTSFLMKL